MIPKSYFLSQLCKCNYLVLFNSTILRARKKIKKFEIVPAELYLLSSPFMMITPIIVHDQFFLLNTIMTFAILEPQYAKKGITVEDASVSKLARDLGLTKHPNGGYFKETDRPSETAEVQSAGDSDSFPTAVTRNPSSLIHFLMTCESPLGKFHTNVTGRTIHVLQGGRGTYVLVHPTGEIETFRVGFDVANGERTQWVVEPGVYKGCYVVPEKEDAELTSKDHLWVSEIVVPGFDFQDMKFLDKTRITALVGEKKASELDWLI